MALRVAVLAAAAIVWIPQGDAACGCADRRQFPGGVVDAASGTAYIVTVANTISAVDLKTGTSSWTSRDAMLPVGVTSNAVVAFRRGENPRDTELVRLDRLTGNPVSASRPFRIGRDPLDSRLFGAALFDVSESQANIIIRWSELGAPGGGAVRDFGSRPGSGIIRMPVDGTVRTEDAAADAVPVLGDGAGTAYRRGAAFVSGSWLAGGCGRALKLDSSANSLLVSLVCAAAAGSPPRETRLLEAPSASLTVTLDGCHVFVETPPDGKTASWSIFSAASSQPIGRIAKEPNAWNPAFVGTRAYYLVDMPSDGGAKTTLKAVDAASGAIAWQIATRSVGQQPRALPPRGGR